MIFQNIEDAIGMAKIGTIKIIIVLNDDGNPELDYVVESWKIQSQEYEHVISDCGFETLDDVLKDIDKRINQ